LLGEYDYRFLNGENIPDVRQRNLSWITTLTREFSGKRVMAITHHLTILATRANFERLSPEQFLHLDNHEKPVNCGVTRYIGNPRLGSSGNLELHEYNRQYYCGCPQRRWSATCSLWTIRNFIRDIENATFRILRFTALFDYVVLDKFSALAVDNP
jgi:hypothetical protein